MAHFKSTFTKVVPLTLSALMLKQHLYGTSICGYEIYNPLSRQQNPSYNNISIDEYHNLSIKFHNCLYLQHGMNKELNHLYKYTKKRQYFSCFEISVLREKTILRHDAMTILFDRVEYGHCPLHLKNELFRIGLFKVAHEMFEDDNPIKVTNGDTYVLNFKSSYVSPDKCYTQKGTVVYVHLFPAPIFSQEMAMRRWDQEP